MPEPFRLRLQRTLTDKFEEIGPPHYEHSMEGRVFRGRAFFGENDPLPMISILEEPADPDADLGPPESASGTSTYTLLVQGFAEDDFDNPTDPAHHLMAHVKAKLSEIRKTRHEVTGLLGFGETSPIVDALEFAGGVVRPPDGEVSAKAYFWLRVTMKLVEDHDNPFA